MFLPQLNEISSGKSTMVDFKGYNHKLFISDGEFFDMQNMTADYYPILSPRKNRGTIRHLTKPNGLFAKDKLVWVDSDTFYYDGKAIFSVEDTPKTFVSMGAWILIFPDKLFYNTSDQTYGSLENRYEADQTVTFTPSKRSDDLSDDGTYLYVKISCPGIGAGFSQYDGVEITGCTQEDLNKTTVLQEVGEDYLLITGLVEEEFTQEGNFSVVRKVPDLDFVTESDNRLWGCSSKNHEIYACKLGDPKNWFCYEGISTDSYAVTVGSDGNFTGACTYLGNVLFFKEDLVHKVFGSQPSNFQVTSSTVRGVERGSEKSMAIVNETLYYQSRNGIVAYSGGAPTKISEAFGEIKYHAVSAGGVGNKYYASMQDDIGVWHMFVWDESKGMWHKEDHTHASYFTFFSGDLYYIDEDTHQIMTVTGNDEGMIEWFAQFGEWIDSSYDNKFITKLQVHVQLQPNASLQLWVKTDGEESWQLVYSIKSSEKRTVTIPIIPMRCERMEMKLSGTGMCKIFSVSKHVAFGSEV